MYVLKVVTVLSLIIIGGQCLSDEMLEMANMLHQQCQEETGVPEEMILAGRKGDFSEDNRLKCYLKCLMHSMAVIDENDGTIDEDSVIGLLPEEHRELGTKVVRACGTKRGSDVCDTAWLTNKCYYAEAPNSNRYTEMDYVKIECNIYSNKGIMSLAGLLLTINTDFERTLA